MFVVKGNLRFGLKALMQAKATHANISGHVKFNAFSNAA